MPPQAPPSFIPKKPLDTGTAYRAPGGVGFLLFIALVIFIVSVVGAGGVFAWEKVTAGSITSKSESLQKAEGAFDLSTVEDLIRTSERIDNASVLLAAHVAPSAVFAFLSQQTLQNVQFTTFNYTLNNDDTAAVTMSGVADSFSSVALQSDQFGASKVLKDVIFSEIKNSAGGSVSFTVGATVDASLINYGKNLDNSSVAPNVPVQATISTSTSSSTPH
ncbi:MAG TPA: PilN domain-containing protein [Candidatus Paceibacterota bacterium]|nr:PilN domain-containing protein [Candidatus Paceibacterota bacterium]